MQSFGTLREVEKMNTQYRLILSAGQNYKSLILSDITKKFTVGTAVNADVRFREQDFTQPFSFQVGWENQNWVIRCSGNAGITDAKNQLYLQWILKPGDSVTIVYGMSRKGGRFELQKRIQDFKGECNRKTYGCI